MSRLAAALNRPVYAVIGVALIAGALRFYHLSYPGTRVFDEVYYSKAGCILIGGTNAQCDVRSSAEKYWRTNKWDVGSWVHPPLGKWMIGLGEKVFGFGPFGWRFSSAVTGTLTCVLIAMIAQLLWGKPIWTFTAGLVLATEDLNFVQSRLSMLDIFVAFWVLLGFLFLLMDRRWMERAAARADQNTSDIGGRVSTYPRTEDDAERTDQRSEPAEQDPASGPQIKDSAPSPLWRPWRYAAGIAFGAAFSTKWSGAFAIPGALLLTLAWEVLRRKKLGLAFWRSVGRTILRESLGLMFAFVLLPVAVYMLIYLPWFHHFGWSLRAWWDNQVAIWDFHKNLLPTAMDNKTHEMTPIHPYLSRPWGWLLIWRPVAYYYKTVGGKSLEIIAIGNVVLFWGSLLWTIPYLFWASISRRKRDWIAVFILVAIATQYLPWFFVGRAQFFFYMTPITPFLALGLVYAIRDASDATVLLTDPQTGATYESTLHPYRWVALTAVLLVVLAFAWFYPVLVASPLSHTWWKARIWFPGWV